MATFRRGSRTGSASLVGVLYRIVQGHRRLIADYASRPEPSIAVPEEMDVLTPASVRCWA